MCRSPPPQSSYTRVWLLGFHASVLDFARFSFHVPTVDFTWMSSAPAADARAKSAATTARLDSRRMNPPYWGELGGEPILCTAARQPVGPQWELPGAAPRTDQILAPYTSENPRGG